MLVLSRKVGEEVVIGDEIKVVVLEVARDKVRLGFAAPLEVPIHRREVYEAIRKGTLREGELDRSESAPI